MTLAARRCIALVAAITIAAFSAVAQDEAPKPKKERGPEARVERMTGQMKVRLDLTDEQVKAVTPEVRKFLAALAKARKDHQGTDDKAVGQLRKEMKPKREAFEKALKSILTEEQWAKHEASEKEARKKGQKATRGRKNAGEPDVKL